MDFVIKKRNDDWGVGAVDQLDQRSQDRQYLFAVNVDRDEERYW